MKARLKATWIGLFVLFAVIVFCVPFMVQHGSDIGAGLNVPVDTLLFSGVTLCLARSQPEIDGVQGPDGGDYAG